MNTLLTIVTCVFINALTFSFSYTQEDFDFAVISGISESLISEDHTAEGLLITLENGDIMHFYRMDPGSTGDHTGNAGRVVKRMSNYGGFFWSPCEPVYDDEYDDRNINGGILDNGRIILTFRRYNAPIAEHIDFNLIYSDDNGDTWSDLILFETEGLTSDKQKSKSIVPGKY